MLVIAGVSGNVGSVAAEILLARGEKIKVIVRDGNKGEAWSRRGAEVAVGNLDDDKFLTATLRGARGFFTLVPPNFAASDPFAYQRSVVVALASAVKAANVPHVVLLSSLGADQQAGTGPIKGLYLAEQALKQAGTKLTAIRASFFQENVGNNVAAAKAAGIFPNFAASADYAYPMIATKDIGALVAESLLSPPAKSEAVDLVGPAYSNRQAADKLGARLGKALKIVDVPPDQFVSTLAQAGLPQPFAESFAEMYTAANQGKLRPVGDRLVEGKTTLDDTIARLLPA